MRKKGGGESRGRVGTGLGQSHHVASNASTNAASSCAGLYIYNSCQILNLDSEIPAPELQCNVVSVEEVAPKDKRICWCQDSMDPP